MTIARELLKLAMQGESTKAATRGPRLMAHEIAADDIVRTPRRGAGNERAPLLVLEPLAGVPRRARARRRRAEIRPIGDGHSNVTYLVRPRRRRVRPAPPAARRRFRRSAHDVLREARVLRGARRAARGSRGCWPCATTSRSSARRSTSWSRWRARRSPRACPPRSTRPSERRRIGEELDRRARRDPRRRLAGRAGSRASASRRATSSARSGASPACGSTTRRARSRRSRRVGAWLGDNLPDSPPGDDRPRRLPPRAT